MSHPQPPVADSQPVVRTLYGDEVADPYSWIRDRADPRVLPLLEAENAYTAAMTAPMEPLQDRLFDEIRSRIQESDLSVPWRRHGWWYQVRTLEGLSYPVHVRRPDDGSGTGPDGDAPESVLLDENIVAEGHDYSRVGAAAVSPDGSLLAWSVDHEGDEAHTLRIRDLVTGLDGEEAIPGTSYALAWAADSATVFYTTLDATQRPHQVWRHVVGTDPGTDVLVVEEPDERFFVDVAANRSGDWILVAMHSAVTSEAWLLDAHRPTDPLTLIAARQQGIEYHVEAHVERLFILSNAAGADDFALYETPAKTPGPESWEVVVPHVPGVRLDDVDALRDHLVIHLRRDGVTALRVVDLATRTSREFDLPEEVGTVSPGVNEEFDTATYRFTYQSLVTPPSVFDEDLDTARRVLRKQQPVLGGYSPHGFETRRVWATADDGTQVPISLVHRRGLARDGSAPCLLYGYGAYEASMDPWFSAARLSLLERGWVWAIAHVRGGGELGRRWYEDGKLLAKPHSFSDFVAGARHLIDSGYTAPDRLVARGGSAGGLLMGGVANLAPELFRAVIAEVPFVDPVNTLLDPSLPLTVTEWEEWGNPAADAEVYRCIRDYSPYENVRPEPYPTILATAGFEDPRVGYHEPAKWVQQLRAVTTGEQPVLLRTELGAGHAGPSGRYDAWRDEAFVLAFAIHAVDADA